MGNSDRAGRRVEERKVEARQRTRTIYVSSPDNDGTRNMVQRVVDTIDFLWNRKKINDQEHAAALKYRAAWDMIQSTVGGVMDFERARGGGVPGGMIAPQYLEAADTIKHVVQSSRFADSNLAHVQEGAGVLDVEGGGTDLPKNVRAGAFAIDTAACALHIRKPIANRET
jgi:hypothetical protein